MHCSHKRQTKFYYLLPLPTCVGQHFQLLPVRRQNIGPELQLRLIYQFACHKLLRESIFCAVKSNLIHCIDVVNFVNKHDLVLFIFGFVLSFFIGWAEKLI